MSKLLKSSGTRLHVVFLDQDISRLDALVAAHRGSRLTRSDLIRNIVHTYLNRVDEKTNERAKHVGPTQGPINGDLIDSDPSA